MQEGCRAAVREHQALFPDLWSSVRRRMPLNAGTLLRAASECEGSLGMRLLELHQEYERLSERIRITFYKLMRTRDWIAVASSGSPLSPRAIVYADAWNDLVVNDWDSPRVKVWWCKGLHGEGHLYGIRVFPARHLTLTQFQYGIPFQAIEATSRTKPPKAKLARIRPAGENEGRPTELPWIKEWLRPRYLGGVPERDLKQILRSLMRDYALEQQRRKQNNLKVGRLADSTALKLLRKLAAHGYDWRPPPAAR
jgi:hypothetical protein